MSLLNAFLGLLDYRRALLAWHTKLRRTVVLIVKSVKLKACAALVILILYLTILSI
jgi:hypothetical protein